MQNRRAGILLPIFSLPSRYGIGSLDLAAYRFVDFLSASGQSEWQILPLGPTGFGDSPYQSFSSYAGNPYFVSLEALISDGLLEKEECEAAELEDECERVDYARQYLRRLPLLRLAYSRAITSPRLEAELSAFCHQNPRICEYALFMAIKEERAGAPWNEWETELRFRDPEAISRAERSLSREIGFHAFVQYRFFRDFDRLHAYARQKGIGIIGDLPIYLSYDSAEVWASPERFCLDEELRPTAVAGCPPDGFSKEGQLWGNPLYRWSLHESEGFSWWVSRILEAKRLCDTLRIDHFRGFAGYYAVPFGAPDAREGRWEKGPGMALFRALFEKCPSPDLIVEDLGFVDDEVRRLVREAGFPNMRVLEFGFDTRDDSKKNEHLPHAYPQNCAAYLGTHDNETALSWLRGRSEDERRLLLDYLAMGEASEESAIHAMIALLMRSAADRVIITMQDWLGLSDEARINRPSSVGENWRWRLRRDQLSPSLCERILRITALCGRRNENIKENEG